MKVDMFGFKRQHKLITSEGMDMIKRQMECDDSNAIEAYRLYQDKEITSSQFWRYSKQFTTSSAQQKYALDKGRFR